MRLNFTQTAYLSLLLAAISCFMSSFGMPSASYTYSGGTFTVTGLTNWSELDSDNTLSGIQAPTASDRLNVTNGAILVIDVSDAIAGEIRLGISGSGNGTLRFETGGVLTLSNEVRYGSVYFGDGLSSGSLDMSSGGTMIISGVNIPNANIGSFNPGSGPGGGTLIFNGAGQQISGDKIQFNNVELVNGSTFSEVIKSVGAANQDGSVLIAGSLNIGQGVTLRTLNDNTFVRSSGTVQGEGTIVVTRSTGLNNFSNQYIFSNYDLSGISVVFDNTVSQNIDAMSYSNLRIAGARGGNNVTFAAGTINISGTFAPAATFTTGRYIHDGNTISFTGNNQTLSTPFVFDGLTMAGSGNLSVPTNTKIRTLTLVSGTLVSPQWIDIADGGTITGSGGAFGDNTFVQFYGSGAVNGVVTFPLVSIGNGAVDFGLSSSIRARLQINGNGSVVNNAPSYLPGSELLYQDGEFTRGLEWSSTSGRGYPYNVVINRTGTILNMGIGDAECANNLIISTGNGPTTLNLATTGSRLTVFGDLRLEGTLNANNSTLIVKRHFENTGTFHAGTSTVEFSGTANQALIGNAATFYSLHVKSSGVVTIPRLTDIKHLRLESGNLRGSGDGDHFIGITDGGSIQGAGGDFDQNSYPVIVFRGAATVSGPVNFRRVSLNGAVDFGNQSVINVDLQISGNGAMINNAPVYAPNSFLVYLGNFTRGLEWSSSSGKGFPYNVRLREIGPTTLNMGSGDAVIGGRIDVDGTATLNLGSSGSLTITSLYNNGTVHLNGSTLKIKEIFSVNGTFNAGTGTVEFAGPSLQTVPALTYYNLTSSNIGSRTLASAGVIEIKGTFTPGDNTYSTSGSTVKFNTETIHKIPTFSYHNLILAGNGIKDCDGSVLSIYGNLSREGGAMHSSGLRLKFVGSNSQTITGMIQTDFVDLDNPSGILLTEGLHVAVNLTFVNGIINSGINVVVLSDHTSVTGAGPDRFVNGRVRRFVNRIGAKEFPVGKTVNGTHYYMPAKIENSSASDVGVITVEWLKDGLSATIPEGYSKSGTDFWRVSGAGELSFPVLITLSSNNFIPVGLPKMLKVSSSSTEILNVISDVQSYTAHDLNSFGDFALIEQDLIQTSTSVASTKTLLGSSSVKLEATVTPAPVEDEAGVGTVEFFLKDYPTVGTNLSIGSATRGPDNKYSLVYDPNMLNSGIYIVVANFKGTGIYSQSTSHPTSNGTLTIERFFYRDADQDGYGNENVSVLDYQLPEGYVLDFTDCNDGNSSVHPGSAEICNGIDDDCDGQVDEDVKITFYLDADGDGFGNLNNSVMACTAPAGYVDNSTDCNDNSAAINPNAIEVCKDGIDNNCDGQIDEGCVQRAMLNIQDASGYEADQVISLKVTLSKKEDLDVIVYYSTKDGTATSKDKKNNPADYVGVIRESIVIPAGAMEGRININVISDDIVEGAEHFTVAISSTTVAVDTGTATITLHDGSASAIVTSSARVDESEKNEVSDDLSVQVLPNPTRYEFTLIANSSSKERLVMRVFDNVGRILEARSGLAANTSVRFGANFRPGMYYVEVTQGSQRRIIKLMKTLN